MKASKSITNGVMSTVMAMGIVGLMAGTAQAVQIFSSSFESPVVTGRSTTNPDGWVGAEGYGTGTDGIENEDSGTFTTPYGAQAGVVWGGRRSCLTTSEASFDDVLVAGLTYTVTFNVAKPSDLSGYYQVQLLALDAGDPRNDCYYRPLLTRVTGTATTSDMSEEVTLTYITDASNPYIGKMLAIRIMNDTQAVIDNLRFSDSNTTGDDIYPPALSYRYPRDEATTMAVDYPLVMTFNEEVVKGTGNITVFDAADDSVCETIDVTSGQVAVDSNVVTVTRAVDLERGKAYYVNIESTAINDLAANAYPGITGTTAWNFSTPIPDGSAVIYETSFESPDVSGRVSNTAPDGWVLSLGAYGTGSFGVIDEDCGYFSTPYGSQVLSLWGFNRSIANSDATAIEDVLVAEHPYTVSFNVVKQTDISGAYTVQLVAYDPGEPRNGSTDSGQGTVLAGVSGTAVLSDMAAAMDAFTFTADVDNANVGKLLGVRVRSGGTIDNLKLSWVPPPPAGTVMILR